MPPSRKIRIALAVLCALPLVAGAQQGLRPKPQSGVPLNPAPNAEDAPLFVEADRVQGTQDQNIEAFGNARLRKGDQAFFADWMRHDTPTDVLTAKGNVRIEQGQEIIEGESLRYELATDRGNMEQPRYMMMSVPVASAGSPGVASARFAQSDGRGTAERLLFEGPGKYRIESGSYTTCEPGNDAWFLRAKQLDIDRSRDVGVARDASIVFFDQPIFYTPYLSFSLHQQRKSGILTPSYRTSNTTGLEFTVPYYWNIAPDMDATLYPRYMTKRGLQLGGEFRYLSPRWNGETRAEYLANDQQISRDRWGLFAKHQQTLGNTWNGTLNINRVSDGKYFTELSTMIAGTSQVHLTNDATLARGGTWGDTGTYSFSAFAQRWQTLQSDPLAPLVAPYNRQPQLSLSAQRLGTRLGDFDLLGSFVAFEHPSLVNGRRVVVNPSFSLPLQNSFAFVTPKLGAHITRYSIGAHNVASLPDTTRTIPIFSAETGVVFEREMRSGGVPLIQTLEPKAYYVYIPYKDQSRVPNFDSGLQDINFATIFTENQFSGSDRINDANQLTVGVTSRFIDTNSGIERLRAAVAQRYYFEPQRVTIPGVPSRASDSNSSDLLAALGGNIAKNWTAEAGWQYNTDLKQTQKFNIAARYQPQAGKVVNLAYRETANTLRQADFSAQWPIDGRWTVVGRWNYSLRDGRTLEALAGVEYNDRCWVLRVVGHRFATTTNDTSTSIFIQLELSGLSRIGTSPLDALRRNIGGYKQLDPRATAPVEYNVPGLF